MSDHEPIRLALGGDAAAEIKSEAIIEECEPEQIVRRALGLYMRVAPDLRNGGRIILEVDATNDTIENRRGWAHIFSSIKSRFDGHPDRTVNHYNISFYPLED